MEEGTRHSVRGYKLGQIVNLKQFHDATNAHIVIQSWSQMNTAMGTFEMYSKAADQGKRSRLSLVWNNVRSVREWGFDDMVAECMCA